MNARPISTNLRETQTHIIPPEMYQSTNHIQTQQNWNSHQHHVEKFQEFMSLHSAQLSSRSAGGFDASTVGHNRSITAMIHPPSELPHAVDLLRNNQQQTPASLAATRTEQRKANQKKEARKQVSNNGSTNQQKENTSAPNALESHSLVVTDEQ